MTRLTTTAPRGATPAAASLPANDATSAKDWVRILASYREPRRGRALFELAVTILPFLILWLAMLASLDYGYWLTLLLALPTAGFLARLFMIQHDCGHGSFFARRRADDWVGRCLGVLTLTPYAYWRRSHAVHHASSGNLDRRGTGDIETLTVREYLALSPWRQWLYRLSRHPLVILGLGPTYVFVLQHRLPLEARGAGRAVWVSVLGTNLAIVALSGALVLAFGWQAVLAVHLPIVVIAATIGVGLFFVQHQFEGTIWDDAAGWDLHEGALHGSSHFDLPAPLRWLTGNIGIHHVHHLASRIPGYRLAEVLEDHPELRPIGRITLRQSLRCFRLALWDEDKRRLVGFGELRERAGVDVHAGTVLGDAGSLLVLAAAGARQRAARP